MKTLSSTLNKNLFALLTVLLMTPVFSVADTEVKQRTHSGVIHFTGSIVHPPCMNSVSNQQQLIFNCLNDKADMVEEKLDIKKIAQSKDWGTMNNGRGVYTYHWVDKQSQLGLLTIKYI
ncbi:hypothetical protein AB7W88_14845 [Providencia vermicola]|uniref:Type 1 fimbrial protein n=1 Tax=Providencia stuartii TaxID=588 RepID=A0AAI9I1B1_PROST|nr:MULTISPECIES: hypothetical protein [Providencia]ELR5044777.1 hypothetical protein [Providencia rettgeri]ELR5036424.1 hypothetical protein [Providencia stuartii]ELR5143902.1 hypothetical protein [Providencia stuartii]ELR5292946.1 hypothetical protein [Providencia stuartii]ELZ5940564.1 hypothetical protein [Providencia stuartii]